MWENLKDEIIISLIMTVGSKVLVSIYRAVKSSVSDAGQRRSRYSSKTLRWQFYICSFVGMGAIYVAWANSTLIPFAATIGFWGFFFAWSAFEVAADGNAQAQRLIGEIANRETNTSGENSN